jgi:hypothetical protein
MASTLFDIYNEIKLDISNLRTDRPVIVYTGVGTFAGRIDKVNGILERNHYHQFPPFLQDIYKSDDKVNIYLVLIDPYQEDPPYVTQDETFFPTSVGSGAIHLERLTVHTLRKFVHTAAEEKLPHQEEGEDITAALTDFNDYAIQHDITFFYHDFTGKPNAFLADHFDDSIVNHHDHIIYGLCCRHDGGCYIDLNSDAAYMPYRIHQREHRACFSFLNYFQFLLTAPDNHYQLTKCRPIDIIHVLDHDYNNIRLVLSHYNFLLENIQHKMINDILTHFRVVFRVLTGVENDKDVDPLRLLYNLPPPLVKKTKSTNDYGELFNEMKTYYGDRELTWLAKLKGMDMNGPELLEFMLQGDKPYEWYKTIKEMLRHE